MKKYKVTKKQIIQAIISEPLTFNKFFDIWKTGSNRRNCSVCAVGAVLRTAIKKDWILATANPFEATDFICSAEDLDYALDADNFLSILSSHHEYFAENFNCEYDDELKQQIKNMDLQRLHLLNVIEAFCPKVVEFYA